MGNGQGTGTEVGMNNGQGTTTVTDGDMNDGHGTGIYAGMNNGQETTTGTDGGMSNGQGTTTGTDGGMSNGQGTTTGTGTDAGMNNQQGTTTGTGTDAGMDNGQGTGTDKDGFDGTVATSNDNILTNEFGISSDACKDGSFYHSYGDVLGSTLCNRDSDCGATNYCCLHQFCICGIRDENGRACVPPYRDEVKQEVNYINIETMVTNLDRRGVPP